jgi:hypothetical protein
MDSCVMRFACSSRHLQVLLVRPWPIAVSVGDPYFGFRQYFIPLAVRSSQFVRHESRGSAT